MTEIANQKLEMEKGVRDGYVVQDGENIIFIIIH